ncbi:MAG: flagellar brake protein [Desulfobacterales bacterium]
MSGKNIAERDKTDYLDLEPGTELSLVAEGLKGPLKSNYIGKKEHQYIVIAPPSHPGGSKIKLLQSGRITIKYSFKENVLQFSSRVIAVTHEPLTLLLLEYPTAVEKLESRSHKRITCFISANIFINNETKAGVIKNISKSGCCCIFDAAANRDNALQREDDITMSFSFPGIIDRQEVLGKIKAIQNNGRQLEVRIEFAEIAWWVPPYD